MSWYSWQGTRLLLDLRIQPRASRNEVAGLLGDRLRVRIKSPPVDGRANQCLAEFLGEQFGVPASRVEIVGGDQQRNKRIAIRAPKKQPEWFLTLGNPEAG